MKLFEREMDGVPGGMQQIAAKQIEASVKNIVSLMEADFSPNSMDYDRRVFTLLSEAATIRAAFRMCALANRESLKSQK